MSQPGETPSSRPKLSQDKEDIKKIKTALDGRRRVLYDLLVMDAQKQYLAEANRLRAQGLSTAELREHSRPAPKRHDHA